MTTSALSELLETVDIQDWLDTEGIDYRIGGAGQLNIRECPVCGDSRWKVYLNQEHGRGLCFHGECNAKFNLFSFARAHLGTDTRGTALHFESYVRGTGGMPVAPKVVSVPVTPGSWQMPSSIPLPTSTGMTHPFLIERRITLATQAMFGLRFCDEGSHRYVNHEGLDRVQDFSQRILIPVEDLDGEIKTFQGRDVTGEAEKRYLFPASLPGTGRFLYGASYVRNRSHLIICEGPFDVMATHQAIEGMQEFKDVGAIGSFGLSIGKGDQTGDDQLGRLRILKREGLKTLTFLWDGEHGAFKQAVEAGRSLREEGFKVRIGMLPQNKDPADVSTEIVRSAIREAQSLTDHNLLRFTLQNPYS